MVGPVGTMIINIKKKIASVTFQIGWLFFVFFFLMSELDD